MEQTIWSRISQTKLNVGRHLFVAFSLTRLKVWRVVNCQTFSILGLFCWLIYFELSNRRMNDMLLYKTKEQGKNEICNDNEILWKHWIFWLGEHWTEGHFLDDKKKRKQIVTVSNCKTFFPTLKKYIPRHLRLSQKLTLM